MLQNKRIKWLLPALAGGFLFSSCGDQFTSEARDGYTLVKNKDAATLAHADNSGIKLLTVDRNAFKDLNKNGSLDSYEERRLLPFQMPADMLTVEAQLEDVPRDMQPYTDADGHSYDFAFGLNWNGVIQGERVNTYK